MGLIFQSVFWNNYVPEKLNPEQFLSAVTDAGYKAVEFVPDSPARLWEGDRQWQAVGYFPRVKDRGLVISAKNARHPLTIGLNRRDLHDRLEEEIRVSIAAARRSNIPNLVCFSGNRNGLDDQAGAEIRAEGLIRVASEAENAGVTLVLELLNSKVDHPDYQADHTAWGLQVCRAVASPSVKLLYDIYHMQIMEGDIIRTIRSAKDHIGLYRSFAVFCG